MNTVTSQQIKDILDNARIEVETVMDKCTIVTCRLPNGFILVESNACIDPVNYNETLGLNICMKRIENKVWELEGYALQKQLAVK